MNLERRQRADTANELDAGSPQRNRQMHPGCARPAQGREPAQHHERHECGMDDQHEIGEQSVMHLLDASTGMIRIVLRSTGDIDLRRRVIRGDSQDHASGSKRAVKCLSCGGCDTMRRPRIDSRCLTTSSNTSTR